MSERGTYEALDLAATELVRGLLPEDEPSSRTCAEALLVLAAATATVCAEAARVSGEDLATFVERAQSAVAACAEVSLAEATS